MKITYENGWEYTDIHIDLPVPYEDNYQMRMLRANEIPGLAGVKGSGLDGNSRYTYRISGGISIGKKYEAGEMKKADVQSLIEALAGAVEALSAHMLSPDGLILTPELIFTRSGTYQFCYLPVSDERYRAPVCRSFHLLTEYFVGKLDYHDTEGIFLVYKLHKETMKECYELRRIMEECRQEEKEFRRETALREKKKYRSEQMKKDGNEEPVIRKSSLSKADGDRASSGPPDLPAVPEKKGFIKRAVSRFRTGRWGEWKDLITEMDEGGV